VRLAAERRSAFSDRGRAADIDTSSVIPRGQSPARETGVRP
jgi:hypothetical protein